MRDYLREVMRKRAWRVNWNLYGNLLDLKVDARDLEALASLLDKMK